MSDGEALAALISAASFLLAVIGLATAFANPASLGRIVRIPIGPGFVAGIAVVLVGVVSIGAGAAWWHMFWGQDLRCDQWLVAGALASLILVQPVLALLLALGLRPR